MDRSVKLGMLFLIIEVLFNPFANHLRASTVIKALLTGSTAKVFLIKDEEMGLCVYKNIVLHPKSTEERFFKIFDSEVAALSALKHPFIVKLLGYQRKEKINDCSLTLEYCNGGDLLDYINNTPLMKRILELDNFFTSIGKAVLFLHLNGFIHRDIKPENVLLHIENGIIFFKLADFGFAKYIKGSNNRAYTFLGTLDYLAPEVAKIPLSYCNGGERNSYSYPIDWYAFGLLFGFFRTGYHPFDKTNKLDPITILKKMQTDEPFSGCDDLDEKFKRVACSFLEKDPDQRANFFKACRLIEGQP